MKLHELQAACHAIAVEKGWHQTPVEKHDVNRVLAMLALVHSEVSEAVEAVRIGEVDLYCAANGKPEGLPAELADVVIRILDMCGAMGIDLQGAIDAKMTYNRTRSHRHGGKLA